MRTCLLLLTTPFILAACEAGTDPSAAAPDVVVETIGDTTVVRTLSGSVWGAEATLVPEVSIGELDGPDEYLFGLITSIAADDDLKVYAFDFQSAARPGLRLAGDLRGDPGPPGGGTGRVQPRRGHRNAAGQPARGAQSRQPAHRGLRSTSGSDGAVEIRCGRPALGDPAVHGHARTHAGEHTSTDPGTPPAALSSRNCSCWARTGRPWTRSLNRRARRRPGSGHSTPPFTGRSTPAAISLPACPPSTGSTWPGTTACSESNAPRIRSRYVEEEREYAREWFVRGMRQMDPDWSWDGPPVPRAQAVLQRTPGRPGRPHLGEGGDRRIPGRERGSRPRESLFGARVVERIGALRRLRARRDLSGGRGAAGRFRVLERLLRW